MQALHQRSTHQLQSASRLQFGRSDAEASTWKADCRIHPANFTDIKAAHFLKGFAQHHAWQHGTLHHS